MAPIIFRRYRRLLVLAGQCVKLKLVFILINDSNGHYTFYKTNHRVILITELKQLQLNKHLQSSLSCGQGPNGTKDKMADSDAAIDRERSRDVGSGVRRRRR